MAQLKADRETEVSAAEAARQAKLSADTDIASMLDNVDMAGADEDKYEKLSQKQLIEVIAGAVETAMDANSMKLKDEISQTLVPGTNKVMAMEKALMSMLGHAAAQEARGKHEDFDNHSEAITKIMGEVPGITFERAYLLAKSEAAGKTPPKGQVETEKPTDTAWSPQGAQGGVLPSVSALQAIADRGKEARDNAAVTTSGTVGIRNIISAGVDRMQASKGQE